ncbi:MAG: 3-hydroxyacyl-CoA dehydrogenase NAD-binding domain-containing protein, partial [Desulfatiglandales bacterium]|nr:3-hydroxyacyl-CoA dehydrogenase NAD-binding domain-containing protein [Desulfatiglandales bacterium]
MEIKKVGVVGCGIMGSGITQVCAQSGYEVLVSEVDGALLKKGLASIEAFLVKSVEKGKISSEDKQ